MSSQYQIAQTSTGSEAIGGYSRLLGTVFEKPDLFTEAYLNWQYNENPDGHIVGFNAFAGGTLAAHYAAQPILASMQGGLKRGLLSLNTATHPGHQGKGLFVQLANRTYEYAATNGYDFVIGVANQNSVHGFTKKLGFTLLGSLHAKLGTGPLHPTKDTTSFAWSRHWSQQALLWRLNNPVQQYGIKCGRQCVVTSRTAYPAINAVLGIFDGSSYRLLPRNVPFSLLNIWIGADRGLTSKTNLYFNVPNRLRPAPLYLIFKSLNSNIGPFGFDDVYFQALDFDAY